MKKKQLWVSEEFMNFVDGLKKDIETATKKPIPYTKVTTLIALQNVRNSKGDIIIDSEVNKRSRDRKHNIILSLG